MYYVLDSVAAGVVVSDVAKAWASLKEKLFPLSMIV